MRTLIGLAFGVAVAGVAFAQDLSEGDGKQTLAEVVASEGVLAYRLVPETQVYEFKLLTKDAIQKSRTYYANREENLDEYRRLEVKHRRLSRQVVEARVQGEALGGAEADLKALKDQIDRVSRPTGYFHVAEVIGRGADFVVLQNLGETRGKLIPVYQIKHVIMRNLGAEPPHALEPATGAAPDGTSSAPAQ